MEKYIDRNTYRQIKSMSRERLMQTMCDLYDSGYQDAVKQLQPDYDMLRKEVLKIHGIGDVKADLILEVIRKCLEHKEGDS